MNEDRIRKKGNNRRKKSNFKLGILYLLLTILVVVTFVRRKDIADILEKSRVHSIAQGEDKTHEDKESENINLETETENENILKEKENPNTKIEDKPKQDEEAKDLGDPYADINIKPANEEQKSEEKPLTDEQTKKESEKESEKTKEDLKAENKSDEKAEKEESEIKIEPAKPAINEPAVRAESNLSYENLSNKELSWWYRVPKPLNESVPAKIDEDISNLIAKYNGIWQDGSGKKRVFITMDEGYEFEDNTTRILDIAKEKDFKISFFITGGFIKLKPDLVKRMLAEGHLIANHTDKHKNGAKALEKGTEVLIEDITKLETMYEELTGQKLAHFMRPPEGVYSERSLAIIKDLGYRPTFWSFAYHDWDTKAQPSLEEAKKKILGQLHPGSVLLLHAVSKTNVEILPDLIDEIRAQGYSIETLDNF